MLSLKNWLNNYFGFTKSEYNGMLVLMVLIVLITGTPYLYAHFFVKPELLSKVEHQAIQQLNLVSKQTDGSDERPKARQYRNNTILFNFDPNQISITDWQRLGLSAKQAQSILNYRNKGGKFRKAEDLQKMYTISPEMFKRLQPYITIAENKSLDVDIKPMVVKSSYPVRTSAKQLLMVNINLADTAMLDEIRGIGPAFARRIVKYRDRLGGFYQKEQLMEVYGIDSLKFEEIKAQLLIDASAIIKININKADFETLKNHPYLKYKEINAIVQYRKQHGNYNNMDDLKKVLILSPKTLTALAPYLIF